MGHAYLTTTEAAAVIGCSRWTLSRRIHAGELATLHVLPTLRRVEARAVSLDAPPPIPGDLPALIDTTWLARHWRMHRYTAQRLARDGWIPASMREGRWVMPRAVFAAFIRTHTVGGT